MSKKVYGSYLLELTGHVRLEDALEEEHKAFTDHLEKYREPNRLNFLMHDGLNVVYGLCCEADFADTLGGFAIPFYRKWGEDTVRGKILYDLCITDRPTDGGELVLITQFYAELIELVRENIT